MLQRATPRADRRRRLVGAVLVLALLVLVVLSAAHAGEGGDGHTECSTCDAAAGLGGSLLTAPVLVLIARVTPKPQQRPRSEPCPCRPSDARGHHASRAPPVLA